MIFVPSSATWPSFASPAGSHKLETLPEPSGERLQMTLAEVADGAEIRRIEPDNAHDVDPLARRLGDPARRVDAVAIAGHQQRRRHRRIERRPPALASVACFDLAKVELLKRQRQNEASQAALADNVLHPRRRHQRLIDRPGAEGLAHRQAESDSRPRRHQNPLFLRQASFLQNDLRIRLSVVMLLV